MIAEMLQVGSIYHSPYLQRDKQHAFTFSINMGWNMHKMTPNALSGQTNYLDNYIIGRRQIIAMYHKIVTVYSECEKIYVAQDNWFVHQHLDVLNALKDFPYNGPVWMPMYSPWLNPIEKLWLWLRQAVLRIHYLANDWKELRNRVRLFIQQFDHGSTQLLCYVGLFGDGCLALAIANCFYRLKFIRCASRRNYAHFLDGHCCRPCR